MTEYVYANNARSVLASAITDTDTTFMLATGHGARFPSPGVGEAFRFRVIYRSGALFTMEICECTARSGDELTVTRKVESVDGETPVSYAFDAGADVELVETAGVITGFRTALRAEVAASIAAMIGASATDIPAIIVAADADVTLTAEQASRKYVPLNLSAWTQARSVIVPDEEREYVPMILFGSYPATVKTALGTGKQVSLGRWLPLLCDGVDVIDPVTELAKQTDLDALEADINSKLGPFSARIHLSSGSQTIPANKLSVIVAIAAGASGGVASLSEAMFSTGGNGGDVCIKTLLPTSDTLLTIAVGAGGASVTKANGWLSGNDGGDSSVTGTGIAMTAKGGKAGIGSNATIVQPANDASSGYDINLIGGKSGNCSYSISASGGGGIFDGNSTATTGNNSATGGGGLGNSSTGVTGGGCLAPSSGDYGILTFLAQLIIDAAASDGLYGTAASESRTGLGAASGGSSYNGGTTSSGAAGYGAGSGGCSVYPNSGTATSGKGGNGLVLVLTAR